MFCEKCGSKLDNDAVFCEKCGFRIGAPLTAQPGEQQAPYGTPDTDFINIAAAPDGAEYSPGPVQYNPPAGGPEISKKSGISAVKAVVIGICSLVFLSAAVPFTVGFFHSFNTDSGSHEENYRYYDDDQDTDNFADYSDDAYLFNPDNQIERQVIWESNGVTVTASELSHPYQFSSTASLELIIENKSGKDIILESSHDTVSLNDYDIPAFLYQEVEAGKTASASLTIQLDEAETAGIYNVNRIALELGLLNTTTYDTIASSGTIVIDTLNNNTDDSYDFAEPVYEQNELKVSFAGIQDSEFNDDKNVIVVLENKTDRLLKLEGSKISVNDCDSGSFLFTDVRPGQKAVQKIIIQSDKLDKYGIDEIEKLEMNISGYDENSREYKPVFTTDKIIIETE